MSSCSSSTRAPPRSRSRRPCSTARCPRSAKAVSERQDQRRERRARRSQVGLLPGGPRLRRAATSPLRVNSADARDRRRLSNTTTCRSRLRPARAWSWPMRLRQGRARGAARCRVLFRGGAAHRDPPPRRPARPFAGELNAAVAWRRPARRRSLRFRGIKRLSRCWRRYAAKSAVRALAAGVELGSC